VGANVRALLILSQLWKRQSGALPPRLAATGHGFI
jgi:hypothetical protein